MRSTKDLHIKSADFDPLRANPSTNNDSPTILQSAQVLEPEPDVSQQSSNISFLAGERSILYRSNRSTNNNLQCIIMISPQAFVVGQMCVTNFRVNFT